MTVEIMTMDLMLALTLIGVTPWIVEWIVEQICKSDLLANIPKVKPTRECSYISTIILMIACGGLYGLWMVK